MSLRHARYTLLPAHAMASYQTGVAAYEDGRHAEAVAILSRLASCDGPAGSLTRFYLGRSHFALGIADLRHERFKQAIDHLQQAATLLPASADLARHLAAALVADDRIADACDEWSRQLDRGHEDDGTAIRLALGQWKQGLLDRAMATLSAAIARHPCRAELHFHLALLQVATDDEQTALQTLRDAADLAPANPAIRQHLGLVLGARGDVAAAVLELRIAQRLAPHDAYLTLQLAYAEQAARGAGVAAADDVIEPPWPAPDEDALRRLGEIIAAEPDFVAAFLSLPCSPADGPVFSILAATLERALERHPEYADLHFHCSQVYARLGRRGQAITAAESALRIAPRYVAALIQLGRLYAETDQADEAIDRLRQAVSAGGDYPDVHYLLGRVYLDAGDAGSARHAFEQALRLNADYADARKALRELAAA